MNFRHIFHPNAQRDGQWFLGNNFQKNVSEIHFSCSLKNLFEEDDQSSANFAANLLSYDSSLSKFYSFTAVSITYILHDSDSNVGCFANLKWICSILLKRNCAQRKKGRFKLSRMGIAYTHIEYLYCFCVLIWFKLSRLNCFMADVTNTYYSASLKGPGAFSRLAEWRHPCSCSLPAWRVRGDKSTRDISVSVFCENLEF